MKIRINDLARELEVKSKAILDVLPVVGVTEKKTHSSSIEADEAERVRAHFQAQSETQTGGSGKSSRARVEEPDAIKTKIDLSHISKPGDVLKLITQKQQAAAAPPVKRPVPP
ncbi:MAG TPA: translation initiation factor IF-2 N-terminal domain-containing protein, partial [Terriglobales bacterium]|nr:translation initiation factor IF-2 N-terminal domain-containing protein [Terriglobales bacterium]